MIRNQVEYENAKKLLDIVNRAEGRVVIDVTEMRAGLVRDIAEYDRRAAVLSRKPVAGETKYR